MCCGQKMTEIVPGTTDAAVENKDPNNSVNVTIGPRRLPFPADEYTGNPKYIDQAVEMLNGPDAAGTKLWWDKKDHSIENSQSSN